MCISSNFLLLFLILCQDDKIRSILKQIESSYKLNHEDAKVYQRNRDQSLLPLVNYRHSVITRSKRCILAYLYQRLKRIKNIRWEIGPVIPASMKANMCAPEEVWFNKYSDILSNYMMSFSDETALNLTDYTKPPKSLYIEVKCLVNDGRFELDTGETMSMQKNTIHYLPRTQAEPLIRKGILQHLK